MAERVEILDTLTTMFVVREKHWDDRDYEYFIDDTMWLRHTDAVVWLESNRLLSPIIVKRVIQSLSDGRIEKYDTIIYQDGKWVDQNYDPRMNDPEYKTYLRLKEKFEK